MNKRYIAFVLVLSLCFWITPIEARSYENGENIASNQMLEATEVSVENGVVYVSRTYSLGSSDEARTFSADSYTTHVNEVYFAVPREGCSVDDVIDEINESATARSAGNKTETDRDSSISVEGTITINYDRQTINDVGYVKLTGVSGGYTILDNQVRVNSQYINTGCTGMSLGIGWVEQSEEFSKSSASWSYSPPSDWVYVSTNNGITNFVGANCEFTLQRVGSDYIWVLYVENNL